MSKTKAPLMKAMTYYNYGSPDELSLEELTVPIPKADEVLVKVKATSINSWDWDLLTGDPFFYRMGAWRKPRHQILGMDIAGVIVGRGQDANEFENGDEVLMEVSEHQWGGFAEYVCVKEIVLVRKPVNWSFVEAAALPHAGLLAYQGLKGNMRSGARLLINGAGGGVGTLAIQMAKAMDMKVTGVDRSDKLMPLISLGADQVIDYEESDYTQSNKQYDLIIDVIAKKSTRAYYRSLTTNGKFYLVGGKLAVIFKCLLWKLFQSYLGKKRINILIHQPSAALLQEMIGFCDQHQIKPVVDQVFRLEELPEAMNKIGNGNAIGKVVIRMED